MIIQGKETLKTTNYLNVLFFKDKLSFSSIFPGKITIFKAKLKIKHFLSTPLKFKHFSRSVPTLDLAVLVQERRLRLFGHVMRSNGEINRVRSRPVPGRKGPGRSKKTWDECVKQDLKVWGLSEGGTQDRVSWRSSVKNSRQEPTPSNRSAPQSMAAPPARRVLGMRTCSFNKTGFDWLIDW